MNTTTMAVTAEQLLGITLYRSAGDIRVFSGDEIVDCDDVVAGWRERASLFFE